MNILPKKRWHVRTKDNIARVRRDEAVAQEEERKKQEKLEFAVSLIFYRNRCRSKPRFGTCTSTCTILAECIKFLVLIFIHFPYQESEARINFLRKKSGLPEKHNDASDTPYHKPSAVDVQPSSLIGQHVNLFADYKTHVKTTNKDLEREKKEEQEKYEKQIGYLTYLGQDTNEALRLKSWYEVAPKRIQVEDELQIVEKDMKVKYNQDPLTLMKALLPPESKTEIKLATKRKRSPTPPILNMAKSEVFEDLNKHNNHKKERKKHKKERHKKHHKEKKRSRYKHEEEALQKRLKLENMRKERLRREMTEKVRQDALLAPKEIQKQSMVVNPPTPRVVQKYNSQFNPELAKQNMN